MSKLSRLVTANDVSDVGRGIYLRPDADWTRIWFSNPLREGWSRGYDRRPFLLSIIIASLSKTRTRLGACSSRKRGQEQKASNLLEKR